MSPTRTKNDSQRKKPVCSIINKLTKTDHIQIFLAIRRQVERRNILINQMTSTNQSTKMVKKYCCFQYTQKQIIPKTSMLFV